MAHKDKCEFCGKLKMVEGTATVGCYCTECHRLVRAESMEAIHSIRQAIKGKMKNGGKT